MRAHKKSNEADSFPMMCGELIGAIRKARVACVRTAESLTEAWRLVEGQMMMIPATLYGMVENLHRDMSYVLIGGPIWKIRRRQ